MQNFTLSGQLDQKLQLVKAHWLGLGLVKKNKNNLIIKEIKQLEYCMVKMTMRSVFKYLEIDISIIFFIHG